MVVLIVPLSASTFLHQSREEHQLVMRIPVFGFGHSVGHNHHGIGQRLRVGRHDVLLKPVTEYIQLCPSLRMLFFRNGLSDAPVP